MCLFCVSDATIKIIEQSQAAYKILCLASAKINGVFFSPKHIYFIVWFADIYLNSS